MAHIIRHNYSIQFHYMKTEEDELQTCDQSRNLTSSEFDELTIYLLALFAEHQIPREMIEVIMDEVEVE